MAGTMSWSRSVLAAALALAAAAAMPADAKPRTDRRSGSGAGGIVEYQTTNVLEGKSITATVRVFVVVPRDRSLPAYVAVGVKEVDDGTGDELFAGTGTAAPGEFSVGPHFATARVTGQVTLLSSTPGVTRLAEVDVVWSPQDATKRIRIAAGTGVLGDDSLDRHRGRVRRMTGVGLVRISDPSRPGYEFSITAPGLGAAWRTRDTSPDVAGPDGLFGSSPLVVAQGATTCTGSWSGYWTWKWDGTKWVATWTWVWTSSGCGYVTS